MTRENPTPGEGHNAKIRKEIIASVCRDLTTLNAKKDEIAAEISDIKKTRIKDGLGMKISDFNVAMRLYNLEEDTRDEFLSTVRETFDALGVGDQLDWLEADKRLIKANTEPDDAAGEKAAAEAGPVGAAA